MTPPPQLGAPFLAFGSLLFLTIILNHCSSLLQDWIDITFAMLQCSIVTLEYNLLLLTPKHHLFKVCSRPSRSHHSPFCHDITGIYSSVVIVIFDVDVVNVGCFWFCCCCEHCICYCILLLLLLLLLSCGLIARLAMAGWGLQLDGHQGHDIKPKFWVSLS